MQEKYLFEYATLRVVPNVEREEFLNVGVVVFCPSAKFLDCIFLVDPAKLHSIDKTVDIAELENYLRAFRKICLGNPNSGPIGQTILSTRFRWLTAYRSTVIQTSRVHPGFCFSPDDALRELYNKLVL